MKKAIMLLATVSLLGFGLNAADATRGPLGFDAYDKNKDGAISKEEFNAVHTERIKAKEEAGMPMRNAANAPEFNDFDTNKDGKITKDEFQKGQLQRQQENQQNRGNK